MSNKTLVRALAALLMAGVLAGCGFQLRGSDGQYNMPFKSIWLSFNESSPLGTELKRNLRAGDTVRVVTDAEYTAWVEGKKKEMAALADDPTKTWTIDELKTRGEAVYAANCVACHQANGKGVPAAFAALDGSQVVNGEKAHQIEVLLNGQKTGKFPTEMPAWKQLSDTEIAAVITYTRNTWSNKAAENIVQPAEVLAARK